MISCFQFSFPDYKMRSLPWVTSKCLYLLLLSTFNFQGVFLDQKTCLFPKLVVFKNEGVDWPKGGSISYPENALQDHLGPSQWVAPRMYVESPIKILLVSLKPCLNVFLDYAWLFFFPTDSTSPWFPNTLWQPCLAYQLSFSLVDGVTSFTLRFPRSLPMKHSPFSWEVVIRRCRIYII